MIRITWRHKLIIAAAGFLLTVAGNAGELRVYAYLTPSFIGPVLESFEAETGIKVTAEYMRASELLARLEAEKDAPGADVVFTMEAKRLAALTNANVLAPTRSARLEQAIPAQHRHPDGLWYGLSKWTRTVFYATKRADPSTIKSYADLARPEWKGRICVRTSNKIYVQSLIASMLAHGGSKPTAEFLNGVVANFARTPIDLDLEQIKGVADGVCDIAIANSYYYARMKPLAFDLISGTYTDAKRILDAVSIHYPDTEGPGVHVNVSGFGMTQGGANPELAMRLMEYLVQPSVQRLYADSSKDYPIIENLKPHAVLQQLGTFREDALPLHTLNQHYEKAESMTREAGWVWE